MGTIRHQKQVVRISALAALTVIVFDRSNRIGARTATARGTGGNPWPDRFQSSAFSRSRSVWIGQGTGAVTWPKSSFMINQLQWAGYGAVLGGIGLILIWQGNR